MLLFTMFPARGPFRPSRGWDCDTWTGFSSRFLLSEPRFRHHAQLVKAIRPRFQRATSSSPAPWKPALPLYSQRFACCAPWRGDSTIRDEHTQRFLCFAPPPPPRVRQQLLSGVRGSGRSPLEFRRPPAPACGKPGETWRTEALKAVLGDWGLVVPVVTMAHGGRALLLLFTSMFPALGPFRPSRGWDCDTWTGFSSRFLLPEPRFRHHAQLVTAIRF